MGPRKRGSKFAKLHIELGTCGDAKVAVLWLDVTLNEEGKIYRGQGDGHTIQNSAARFQ